MHIRNDGVNCYDLCKSSYFTYLKTTTLRMMLSGSQNCQDYCFIVLDIFLALTPAQAKYIAIALAITLCEIT